MSKVSHFYRLLIPSLSQGLYFASCKYRGGDGHWLTGDLLPFCKCCCLPGEYFPSPSGVSLLPWLGFSWGCLPAPSCLCLCPSLLAGCIYRQDNCRGFDRSTLEERGWWVGVGRSHLLLGAAPPTSSLSSFLRDPAWVNRVAHQLPILQPTPLAVFSQDV